MKSAILVPFAFAVLLSACGQVSAEGDRGSQQHIPSKSTARALPATSGTSAPPASFARCRSCHAVEPGVNGIGPSLAGIVGSKAGSAPGYKFSPALKNANVVWEPATLDAWLKSPSKMVPGTKMTSGAPDPEQRKAIIDYLASLD